VSLSDFLVHASQMTYSDMLGAGFRLQKWGWRHPGTGSWVNPGNVTFVACTCSKGIVLPDHLKVASPQVLCRLGPKNVRSGVKLPRQCTILGKRCLIE